MFIFHLARDPPAWLRFALISLLLAFAVDSVAHVVHEHETTVSTTFAAHGPACGYCAAFDGLIDAPKQSYSPVAAVVLAGYVATIAGPAVSFRPQATAQPRGPPR
ncbi:hypothetical protein JM946_26950 [Steroidobacter sp. S1-65]|uniref:DUF2752 domain-containing protein n=1 Tax=Steroidobacter gossypii TaxID=2805490 RepID=A0ABS1X599_9GAMM|nr:hypothetical protein [Steroidobacter gossypii]MBM0108387.1 hypothetical protein [Steroidobacter gossypii]